MYKYMTRSRNGFRCFSFPNLSSTVDIQHKTKAAARVHIIFRRGVPTEPNLSTIDQPE